MTEFWNPFIDSSPDKSRKAITILCDNTLSFSTNLWIYKSLVIWSQMKKIYVLLVLMEMFWIFFNKNPE